MTSKASSPRCAATPTPPASPTASTCSGCWSTTSSSDPRGSPSGIASPSANGPAPGSPQVPARPTRRVTTSGVIHCVGGVLAPPLGFEAVDDSPLPRNGLGNGAAGDDMVSDAHAVRVLNRGYRRARGRAWAVCERQGGSGDVPDSGLARRYRRIPLQITPSPVATTRPASASPSKESAAEVTQRVHAPRSDPCPSTPTVLPAGRYGLLRACLLYT